MDSTPLDQHELASNEEFLRRIAHRLVHDVHEADDLVQDTWLAALRGTAPRDRRLRRWLAGVARNLAVDRLRRRVRRLDVEQNARIQPPMPSPLSELGRASVREALAQAVSRLDERYRPAVVLHFFEGESVFEIAARLRLPVETVRTRIKRALIQLQQDLDRRSAGDRRAWMEALAPFPFASPRRGSNATRARHHVMRWVAVVVGVVGISVPVERELGARGNAPLGTEVASVPSEPTPEPEAGETRRVVAATTRPVRLRIVRADTGEVVANAEVTVDSPSHETLASGADGEVQFDLACEDTIAVEVGATATTRRYRATVGGAALDAREPIPIRVPPCCAVRGRVEDLAGAPIPRAHVRGWDGGAPRRTSDGWPPSTVETLSDERGEFVLTGLSRDFYVYAETAEQVAQSGVRARLDREGELDVVLRLGPPRSLDGRVVDETCAAIAGARVDVQGGDDSATSKKASAIAGVVYVDQIACAATTDARGRFRLERLPRSTAVLSVLHPDHPRVERLVGVHEDFAEITLIRGAFVELELAGDSESAVEGAEVHALCRSGCVLGRTDEHGRARLGPFAPDALVCLRIDAAGWAPLLTDWRSLDQRVVRLVLHAGRTLQGRIVSAEQGAAAAEISVFHAAVRARSDLPSRLNLRATRELSRVGSTRCFPDGSFALEGLPEAELWLQVDTGVPGVGTLRRRITAGTSTVVLASDEPTPDELILRGRLLDSVSSSPLGIRQRGYVRAFETGGAQAVGTCVADEDGRFDLRLLGNGPWRVCAEADGYAPLLVEYAGAAVPGAPGAEVRDLGLIRSVNRTLRFTDRNGVPLAGAAVFVANASGEPVPFAIHDRTWKSKTALDAAGCVRLRGLPATGVIVTVVPPCLRMQQRFALEACAAVRGQDAEELKLDLDLAEPLVPVELWFGQPAADGQFVWAEGRYSVEIHDEQERLTHAFDFVSEEGECRLDPERVARVLHRDASDRATWWEDKPMEGSDWFSLERSPGFDGREPRWSIGLRPGENRATVRDLHGIECVSIAIDPRAAIQIVPIRGGR